MGFLYKSATQAKVVEISKDGVTLQGETFRTKIPLSQALDVEVGQMVSVSNDLTWLGRTVVPVWHKLRWRWILLRWWIRGALS